jgi:hypothetical protein
LLPSTTPSPPLPPSDQIKKAELHSIAELKAVEARRVALKAEEAALEAEEAELAAEEAAYVPLSLFPILKKMRLTKEEQVLDGSLGIPPQARRTPRPLLGAFSASHQRTERARQVTADERLQCGLSPSLSLFLPS